MKRVLFPAVAAAFVLTGSASASGSAVSLRGVVVAKQHGVLLVASPSGMIRTATGQAAAGSRVLVRSGRVVGIVGRAYRARIRGVVVRRTGRVVFLSAAGHLLAVRNAGRRLAAATDTAPAPGTDVQQTVSFDSQGNLDDQGEQQLGQSSQVQIQASVSAVGNGTVTLVIVDANNQQQTLTIPLPAGLTLPSTLVGTQVALNVSFANGQPTANAQSDSTQQGTDEQGDSQGSSQQGDADDGQQGAQTTTPTGQQTTTTDQQGNTGNGGGD
jgi:hypothetical protein